MGSTVADGEERFPGGRASTAGGDERRMREGGLRADAAGFRPGQSEHWMSGGEMSLRNSGVDKGKE